MRLEKDIIQYNICLYRAYVEDPMCNSTFESLRNWLKINITVVIIYVLCSYVFSFVLNVLKLTFISPFHDNTGSHSFVSIAILKMSLK